MSSKAFDDVLKERARQDRLFGDQSNLRDGTARSYLDEEAEIQARRAFDMAKDVGKLTWRHILEEEMAEAMVESDPVRLREELIQVAAVAVAWCEALDKRGQK